MADRSLLALEMFGPTDGLTTPVTLYRRRWWSFLPRLPGLWWWHYALHRRVHAWIDSALAASWMTLMIVRSWRTARFV